MTLRKLPGKVYHIELCKALDCNVLVLVFYRRIWLRYRLPRGSIGPRVQIVERLLSEWVFDVPLPLLGRFKEV
jgi:hypothetical protein